MSNTLPYIHRLVIGDWSGDGHSQREFLKFKASHNREDIIAAYKAASNRAGISLLEFAGGPSHIVCDNYGDSKLQKRDLEKFATLGISRDSLLDTQAFDEEDDDALEAIPEGLAILFLLMVKAALPDFEYELIPFHQDTFDSINGFWQKDFNSSIGYGVLGDG